MLRISKTTVIDMKSMTRLSFVDGSISATASKKIASAATKQTCKDVLLKQKRILDG